MWSSPRLSTQHVAAACRSLATSLRAGIPVVKAFEIAVSKSGDAHLRRIMQDIATQLRGGSDITNACRQYDGVWPDLFIHMVDVAERTGSLPEVLRSLAEHYENNLRLIRNFRSQMIMPMVQLFAAVVLVAFLLWLMGAIMLGDFTGKFEDQATPLVSVLGLHGTSGAIAWLTGWAAVIAGLYVGYRVVSRSTPVIARLHRTMLGVPVIGACLRSFAIARFSWSYALTQEAGLPIGESLETSLAATDNFAFREAASQIESDVMSGAELSEALGNSQLFPEDFIQIVHVGETSGTVPETLQRLSPDFEEQARRSLSALTATLAWSIWAMVAAFIGFIVISAVMAYANLIQAMM